jgi:hypothetical protein
MFDRRRGLFNRFGFFDRFSTADRWLAFGSLALLRGPTGVVLWRWRA